MWNVVSSGDCELMCATVVNLILPLFRDFLKAVYPPDLGG